MDESSIINTQTIELKDDALPNGDATLKNDSQTPKRTRKTIGHYSIGNLSKF